LSSTAATRELVPDSKQCSNKTCCHRLFDLSLILTSGRNFVPNPPEQAAQRFENYELVKGEDGKPVELGRGAMGVTYEAVDVDLHCPVTLKVISERYLSDESARLRFLR
jgi:hypothetical protein